MIPSLISLSASIIWYGICSSIHVWMTRSISFSFKANTFFSGVLIIFKRTSNVSFGIFTSWILEILSMNGSSLILLQSNAILEYSWNKEYFGSIFPSWTISCTYCIDSSKKCLMEAVTSDGSERMMTGVSIYSHIPLAWSNKAVYGYIRFSKIWFSSASKSASISGFALFSNKAAAFVLISSISASVKSTSDAGTILTSFTCLIVFWLPSSKKRILSISVSKNSIRIGWS